MILPSHHPHLQTIVREMPRPVPAGTHVAALDRCTFRGLTTGRASVSGHGITAPPAREVPEPSLSMPAHSHRRNTRAAPAGDGCAAAAVALPELDEIRLALLGLHTCRGDTVVHMRASGPMCHAVYGTGRCRCAGSPSSTSLPACLRPRRTPGHQSLLEQLYPDATAARTMQPRSTRFSPTLVSGPCSATSGHPG
jgi:hypothetical protein